ncbi:hypothetical protein D0865_07443 [Hortaea werneckii]|uniref:Uncharacterized protein n=1 Tax=Hortaea werneckii TaxID=91943 RepID=A0A3M7CBH2_HORWE|nr:hypothetical protein D0865_07443 [Hortaea werneckii]
MIFHILLASLAAVASAAYDGRLARRATCGARAASAIECVSSAVNSNTASVSSFCASSSYLRTVTRTITTRLPSTTTITTAATVGSITVAASTTSTANTTTTLPSTTTAPSIAGTTFTSTITVTETTGTSTEIETSVVTSFTCATPAPSIRKRQMDAVQACAASYGENVLRNACNNCAGIAAATSFISTTVTPSRTRYSTTFVNDRDGDNDTNNHIDSDRIQPLLISHQTTITSGIVTTETTTTTTTVSSPTPTPTSFYLLRGSLPAEIIAEASYIDVVSAPSSSDTSVATFVNGSSDATQFGLLDNGALVQLGRDSRASVNSRDLFNFLYFSNEEFTNAQIGSGSANAVTCSACDDVLTCVTDGGDQFAACPAAGGEYVVLGGGQAGCTEVAIAIDPVMTIF